MPKTEKNPRTVLVTGAAGGLGKAIAQAFASNGDNVVVADINLEGACATAAELAELGVRTAAFAVDITDTESTEELAQKVSEFGEGHIDVVVNNAAMYATIQRSPFEEIDPDAWDQVMAVNLKGPWLVLRAASKYLKSGSRIVNMSSATVFSGSANWAHYVVSKGGVISLTRVLAKELGERNITVNAVAPGFTLTEASYGLMENASTYGVDRGSIKRASQPDDIVGAVMFLASDAAGYVTGQTMVVDGGRQFI